MSNVYKTFDYSQIPITQLRDKDRENLSKIANFTIRNLCENNNSNLLIFPQQLDIHHDGIADSYIFTMDNQKLQTGDLLGFVGINDSQITISTRFAKNDIEDYFLHYMLQKVFHINLLDLQHSISNDRIFDFLAYMFPFYLKRALKQGLYKKYTTNNYNNINVKGTINISNHIKNNTPFNGKIAYRVKEYNCDNDLTQLIRHTIEYIRDYDKRALNNILIKNRNPIFHPYYTEYRILQKLCIQILCHKRLKYGVDNNRIYGLVFSGSWLWEEFIHKTILKECGFSHPQNRAGKGGIYLFNKNEADINFVVSRCKRYPDYFKENFILDAKYKHLDNNRIDRNDMHQIISYMHVEKANIGGFIYPKSTMDIIVTKLGDLRGFGGVIYNIGVPIPQEKETYAMFSLEMTNIQEELKRKILDLS